MNTMTMQKLARFKIMTRRLGGFNVDIFRMAQAGDYARETLARAQEVDNETLILLALELAEALGLLTDETNENKTDTAAKVKPDASTVPERKGLKDHMFGARF